MIQLYAELHNLDTREAYREVNQLLHSGYSSPDYKKPESKAIAEPKQPIDIDKRHQTFTLLLSMLSLSETHKVNLLERGLSEDAIKTGGYKSVPAYGYGRITNQLLKQGCEVNGVPGFYKDETGVWNVNFNPKCSGILVPVRSIEGYIEGMQIRLDRPFDGKKYMWFSSSNKPEGTLAGSPTHFIGNPSDHTLYVTEGAMKANIAHCLSGKSFMAVAGANQYRSFQPAFEVLKLTGVTEIVEAYDMDKKINPYVAGGRKKLMNMASEMGFSVRSLVWDEKYKGVDDYLLHKKMNG